METEGKAFIWKLLGFLKNVLILLFRFSYLLVGLAVILVIAYGLGYQYLTADELRGNDSGNFLSQAVWLNRFFPQLPFWYPLQGGGVSFVTAYPILSHFGVVVLQRFSELDLIQSYRLVGFLTIPAAAVAVYLFSWTRLKNQTVGLIAAVFFLLSPLSWSWLFDWGYFAYTASIPFFVLTFIFFDLYLQGVLVDSGKPIQRLWLLLTVISFALTTLTHVGTGMGLASTLFFYTLILSISKNGLSQLVKGVKGVITVGFASFLVLLFWLVPLYQYFQLANREGLLGISTSGPPILVRGFLSLMTLNFDPEYAAYREISIPILVWGLSILGIILAVKYSRKVLALGLIGWFGILNLWLMFPYSPLGQILSLLARFFGLRGIFAATAVFFPLVAAFGVWALVNTFFSAPDILFKKNIVWRGVKSIFVFSFSLALAFMLIIIFRNVSSMESYLINYGPEPVSLDQRDIWRTRPVGSSCGNPDYKELPICKLQLAREKIDVVEFLDRCNEFTASGSAKPDLCEPEEASDSLVEEFISGCEEGSVEVRFCSSLVQSPMEQLKAENWPRLILNEKGLDKDKYLGDGSIFNSISEENVRISTSPYLGPQIMTLNYFHDIPQIDVYTNQFSLQHGYWGRMQEVLYTDEQGSPTSLNEFAGWLGIKYVFLHPEMDPMEKYREAGWEKVPNQEEREVWQFPEAQELATLSQRPTVLVIGSSKRAAYNETFRVASEGAISYKDVFLVEGEENIDSYNLEQLKQFDLLFLHGYSYKNKKNAWRLLEAYVKEGGSLFIDTGWQFVSKDWGDKGKENKKYEIDLPEPAPVAKTIWDNVGTDWHNTSFEDEFSEIDISEFGPPKWQEDPWGMSLAKKEDQRDGSKIIFGINDNILVASREYGEGRVVWSGLNLISHIGTYDYEAEEIELLQNLVSWLLNDGTKGEFSVSVEREHPDKVEFLFEDQIDSSSLFWRDVYHPDWQATLVNGGDKKELKIYRAGPGFMLMVLPEIKADSRIILEYKSNRLVILARVISVATFILLLGLLLEGFLLGGRFSRRFAGLFQGKLSEKVKQVKMQWVEEEET
jgi:hypothetical protein